MKIDYKKSLTEIKKISDIWCGAKTDAAALVNVAEIAIDAKSKYVAVSPGAVNIMWSWIEGKNIDILCITESKDTNIAIDIKSVFKKGAAGVIIPYCPDMISELLPVAQDLFFGKKLFMSVDIENAPVTDWQSFFRTIKTINTNGFVLIVKDSNSVGNIYGCFDNIPNDFDGQIMILTNNPAVMEGAHRLCNTMRPSLMENLRFFIKR